MDIQCRWYQRLSRCIRGFVLNMCKMYSNYPKYPFDFQIRNGDPLREINIILTPSKIAQVKLNDARKYLIKLKNGDNASTSGGTLVVHITRMWAGSKAKGTGHADGDDDDLDSSNNNKNRMRVHLSLFFRSSSMNGYTKIILILNSSATEKFKKNKIK
ncbi:hypothetical protein PGB90_003251 [Kerria lacca]